MKIEDHAPYGLSSVSVALEVEPQLEDVVVKLTTETTLVRVLPFSVDNFEGDIFIWRTCMKPEDGEIMVLRARSLEKHSRFFSSGFYLYSLLSSYN